MEIEIIEIQIHKEKKDRTPDKSIATTLKLCTDHSLYPSFLLFKKKGLVLTEKYMLKASAWDLIRIGIKEDVIFYYGYYTIGNGRHETCSLCKDEWLAFEYSEYIAFIQSNVDAYNDYKIVSFRVDYRFKDNALREIHERYIKKLIS